MVYERFLLHVWTRRDPPCHLFDSMADYKVALIRWKIETIRGSPLWIVYRRMLANVLAAWIQRPYFCHAAAERPIRSSNLDHEVL